MHAMLCEANASFNSKTSISELSQFNLCIREFVELIGPSPINSGLQPETDPEIILPIGFKEFFSQKSSEQINANTTPSVRGDDVAAVTVPFSINAGSSLDIISKEELERIHPSLVTV